VHELELELAVGDMVQIGDYMLTVIDTDGQEVSFRVDTLESQLLASTAGRPGK
jgi:hypothetical protein